MTKSKAKVGRPKGTVRGSRFKRKGTSVYLSNEEREKMQDKALAEKMCDSDYIRMAIFRDINKKAERE